MKKASSPHSVIKALWHIGVDSVKGEHVVKQSLQGDGLESINNLIIVGKAAASMYEGASTYLSEDAKILLITKYDHINARVTQDVCSEDMEIIESGHPLPDENSLKAGKLLLEFVQSIPTTDSLVMLVSGGASALAEHLINSIGLDDLQQITRSLIADGYSIDEINRIRCTLSRIKGGKLLQYFTGKSVFVYAISDVPANDIDVIGSGIGSRINGTDSINKVVQPIPEFVRQYLPTSFKKDNEIPHLTPFLYSGKIVASNETARDAIELAARQQGFDVLTNSDQMSHDVALVAEIIVDQIKRGAAGIYIWGGESTVNLPDNPGVGGRNQHLALLIAKQISGLDNVVVMVAGTDGSDGPTTSTGAIVDGNTFSSMGNSALARADAGTFLSQQGALYQSGPTGTNVMDLAIAIKI